MSLVSIDCSVTQPRGKSNRLVGSNEQYGGVGEGEVSVTDGPFIEGKELIPGFTVIRVDSKQEAIEWVTKLRCCMGDGELRMAQVSAPGFD